MYVRSKHKRLRRMLNGMVKINVQDFWDTSFSSYNRHTIKVQWQWGKMKRFKTKLTHPVWGECSLRLAIGYVVHFIDRIIYMYLFSGLYTIYRENKQSSECTAYFVVQWFRDRQTERERERGFVKFVKTIILFVYWCSFS